MLAAVARHVQDPQLCRRPATNGAIGSGAGSWLAEVRESHGSGLAGVDGDGLQYTGQGLSLAELRLLAGELPRSEVEQRLELLAEHVAQYHTTNHVTPLHRTPPPQPLTQLIRPCVCPATGWHSFHPAAAEVPRRPDGQLCAPAGAPGRAEGGHARWAVRRLRRAAA